MFLFILLAACSVDKVGPPDDTFECGPAGTTIPGDCSACVDEKCADLVPYCEQDADCTCMEQCLRKFGVGAVDDCLTRNGLSYRPVGFAQLEECVAYACPDEEDECSSPEGWTPPDSEAECDGTGTGDLADGTEPDCAFDDSLAFDPNGDVLQLLSQEGDLCVRLERRDEGSGSLANTSWTLLDLRAGTQGRVSHVDAAQDLCWYSSHHNFNDWAHAWTGSRHYDLALLEDGHGGPRRYHLYAYEQGPPDGETCAPTADGQQCIAGPVLLFPYEP